jgi:LemA protein
MERITIIIYGGILVGAILIFSLIKRWIIIYNKFQYWINRAKRKFADIDVLMQERIDMLHALAQVVKKYDIHEYKTLKNIIEARSRWTKDASLSEKAQTFKKVDNAFLKIEALFERYPKLKADVLHQNIIGHGSISRMESKLRDFRLAYNRVVQKYNERIHIFPRNVVAWLHGFKELDYLSLGNNINNQGKQKKYDSKKLFED